ncbi:hypothetical protein XAC1083_620023 [Xanthomonas citri pv. citri]|nr:hypothetical protein XAC1083_620023 [Xanthomonas citri pv. citri]CEE53779.1 hypothetical protein XAC3608_1200003 [Xanthomonas citri pv. citri]CEH40805.1 hypothetical protein XACLD7_10250020 [Xanthomonas citri pv. citri]CEH61831.1 hypothetical protein XACG102_7430013 [Xanthomonas citri pv. citri]CEH88357.1 hypothetical protein XACB100_1820023 [Xanthomonas citri pv. citri]
MAISSISKPSGWSSIPPDFSFSSKRFARWYGMSKIDATQAAAQPNSSSCDTSSYFRMRPILV